MAEHAHPSPGSVAQAEAAALARAADGDEDAVAVLFDAYAGPVYGFGLRRLGDPALAEELVQAVMLRLWRAAGRYEPGRGSVRTWVFAIARTAAVDLHRRQPRAQPVDPLPDRPDPIDELDGLLRAEAVRAALDRLSDEHREILEYAYFRGFAQSEIADLLRLPLGTVKSRTFYALKAFRLACDELEVGR
jgi:RNA polymerase sigma-70 factor, ECF subfamily